MTGATGKRAADRLGAMVRKSKPCNVPPAKAGVGRGLLEWELGARLGAQGRGLG